jgi:hypothetical protein
MKFIILTNIAGKAASGWADRLNCIHWRYEEIWTVRNSTSGCNSEHILLYSMVLSPAWEANWFVASHKFPEFHGTPRFITALTSVRHLSLSWASPIHVHIPTSHILEITVPNKVTSEVIAEGRHKPSETNIT